MKNDPIYIVRREPMTSRERVLAAINHQPHDRIPVDIGGSNVTTLTLKEYENLRRELGLGNGRIRVFDPIHMLAEIEAPIRKALQVDSIGLMLGGGPLYGWQSWRTGDGVEVEMPKNVELRSRTDGGWEQWWKGKHVASMPPGGHYFDNVEWAKWRDYPPADLTDEILEDIRRRARICHEETDLAVMLGVPYTLFNGTNSDFLCALMTEKEEAHEHMEIWVEHSIQCLGRLLDAVKDHVQILVTSGDIGTQKGPAIGPELYREMILPHFRRIPEFVHKHSNLKFFYHTCGSVFRLVDSFIEMGVDILNPLQVTAAEMEAGRLVRQFGGRIAFWGGGCDAQKTLVHGTEPEVRQCVRDQLQDYGAVPGYVFAVDHNIQPDVPPRNILAMLDEVRRFKPAERVQ